MILPNLHRHPAKIVISEPESVNRRGKFSNFRSKWASNFFQMAGRIIDFQ